MTDDDHPTYNGRYEVQRRIARGGMADVFLAKDLLLARPVAVKVLFPEFASDPSFVARFRREAQAAANLNHPNVVGVYDWGQEGGTYYIVMEYIDGRSLSEILRTQGSPPPRTAAGIVADVAAALGFAHRNGVVHRDVKPGNIMITSGGHVKVADFGIARAMTASAEENLTQTGSVMGTATYFSPEQAQGHDVDQRSDLYSLGIVMYEMVHGRPPFTAESPIAVAYKHVQESPPGLRAAHPELPVGYEAICMRLLAKSPDDRYPDADALRADLRRFLEGQRVEAPTGAAAAAAGAAGVAAGAAAAGAADPPTAGTAVAEASPTGATAAAPPYEQARSSRTGWFLLLLLLLLGVLGGLLFLFASTLGIGDDTRKEVPDVTGRPVTEAREILESEGFVVNPDPQREAHESVPRDAVIRQDPPAGERVDEGSTITLVVSTGPPEGERAAVPPVEGLDVDEARRRLAAAGFTDIRTSRRHDDEVAEDEVITQSPAAGVEVGLDEAITLTVSNGPPPTTAPPPTQATEPPPETTEPPPETTEPPPSTTEPPPSTTEPPPSTTEPPPSTSSSSSVPADTGRG